MGDIGSGMGQFSMAHLHNVINLQDAPIVESFWDLLKPQLPPIGTISEWSGTLATIPTGWNLCDGTNGTPDLHAKFLRGAPAATEAGGAGGEDTHILLTAEMPAHGHSFSNSSHTHTIGRNPTSGGNASVNGSITSVSTDSVSSGITINNAGSDTAHENRPAFYELAYIMRIY